MSDDIHTRAARHARELRRGDPKNSTAAVLEELSRQLSQAGDTWGAHADAQRRRAETAERRSDNLKERLRGMRAHELVTPDGTRRNVLRDAADRIEELERKYAEAHESWHLANGTAELALKHRDEAERQRDEALAREERLRADVESARKSFATIQGTADNWYPRSVDASVKDAAIEALGLIEDHARDAELSLRAALNATAPDTADTVRVPVEPTEEMVEAGNKAAWHEADVEAVYRAMLAAAPRAGCENACEEARAEERERCARVAEYIATSFEREAEDRKIKGHEAAALLLYRKSEIARDVAKAIRAGRDGGE